jgi:hypothetical protein
MSNESNFRSERHFIVKPPFGPSRDEGDQPFTVPLVCCK